MPKLLLVGVLLLNGLGLSAAPLPASKLTVSSAVSLALQNNRDLIAARFAVAQAEGRLKQAGLWPNPEWETRYASDTAFANEGEYDFATGFKQRFPITGRLTKAKAVARVDVAQAMAEVRNQERLLAGEVAGPQPRTACYAGKTQGESGDSEHHSKTYRTF